MRFIRSVLAGAVFAAATTTPALAEPLSDAAYEHLFLNAARTALEAHGTNVEASWDDSDFETLFTEAARRALEDHTTHRRLDAVAFSMKPAAN